LSKSAARSSTSLLTWRSRRAPSFACPGWFTRLLVSGSSRCRPRAALALVHVPTALRCRYRNDDYRISRVRNGRVLEAPVTNRRWHGRKSWLRRSRLQLPFGVALVRCSLSER
jgi:hypothetical protein